jgi:hypothetical protein
MTMQATEVQRKRGRPVGTIIEGSLTHELMMMETGNVVLKIEKGAHTRVNLHAAIRAVAKHAPEREFTLERCVGFVTSPEGTNFFFYRVTRTY